MRKRVRTTIGLYHSESHQLMTFVVGKTHDTHAEGKAWALRTLQNLAPSPYQFSIDQIG